MNKLRYSFVFLIIIFMTNPYFPWIGNIDIITGDIYTQYIATVIYLIVLVMLVTEWNRSIKLTINNIFIWIVICWVFASFFWSGEPYLTLRRSVALLGTTLCGLYIATVYDLDHFTRIAGWSFLIVNILSLMTIILIPSRGIMVDPPGWRGIYDHKNILGFISLTGIIIYLDLLKNKGRNNIWLGGLLLSVVLLIGSDAITPLLITLIIIFLWCCIQAYINRSGTILVLLAILFLVIVSLGSWLYFTNNVEVALNVLGKDSTFTGRTFIWEYSLFSIEQKPWFGYGYSAFWIGNDSSLLSISQFDLVPHAHNGYLDLCLQIGIIGAILVSLFIISILYKLIRNTSNSSRVNYYHIWPLAFLISLIIYNSAESNLLVQNSLPWMLMSYFGFIIQRRKNIKMTF